MGERLYYTDSFGSILPILHSSIHYKFPDSCSSSDKMRWKCRGIFITRGTILFSRIVTSENNFSIVSLRFYEFVYFQKIERKISAVTFEYL